MKGANAIEDKFMSVGDLFGMRFADGVVFLEVTAWEQIKYDPYDNIGEVAGDDSSGWNRLEDDGDDILFVEKNKKKVIHAGIGQSPSHVRRFTNYPEGENRLRQVPNLGTPRPGESFGYVDGDDSPYAEPTDVEELFIPPGVHLDFNFYNGDTKTHEPILNITMRKYNIRALDPDVESDMNAIRRVLSAGSPMPVANAGSMDRHINFELEEYWETSPLTSDEVESIRGGN